MPNVAIVGIGRLGGALALALSRHGYSVGEFVHRGADNARNISELLDPHPALTAITDDTPIRSEIVLIATPDPEIQAAAASVSSRLVDRPVVMHTSGSLSSDILADLRSSGASVASLHPLVSISDPILGAEKFTNAYFCIEGDDRSVTAAKEIALALGGKPFSIDTALKPLYHASAVMASGHFVALEDIVIEMLSKCGLSSEKAKEILMPLIQSSVENLAAQSNERALTGTFARADLEAFERHLTSFEGRVDGDTREIYLLLARRSLELAEKAGVSTDAVRKLRERIDIAKENCR
jgi:predicted short-subunit dehydrogenase-like oxidoreductase (DUF2520 family)